MIYGNPGDKLIVVEEGNGWQFASEVDGIIQQDILYHVEAVYMDAHVYKAVLIKRELEKTE